MGFSRIFWDGKSQKSPEGGSVLTPPVDAGEGSSKIPKKIPNLEQKKSQIWIKTLIPRGGKIPGIPDDSNTSWKWLLRGGKNGRIYSKILQKTKKIWNKNSPQAANLGILSRIFSVQVGNSDFGSAGAARREKKPQKLGKKEEQGRKIGNCR